MRCVNKRSKDFKKLAEHYNVSIDQLELYTHKYWVETGNEDSFPTAVYIAAQMGKMPYYEQSDSVREFWGRHYPTPKEYTTKEGWQKAYSEAKTYFPEHALVTYNNSKGNYVLTVRKPVDTIKPSVDDFIKWNAVEQQDKEDYQLITDNLVSELENNRNFAQANKLKTRLSKERRINRQLDTTLESIDNAVQTGQWSNSAIDNLNNLVKSIKDGEVDFERTVGERFSFTSGISEAHAGASIITRGAYGSSETKPGDAKQQYERDAAQGKQQEKAVESWAKANDLWLNDYTDEEGNKADTLENLLNSQWQYFDQGSEAEVFRYDDNTVLKSINLSHSNDNVAKQLDKIAIFNNLFPETALQVVGFGRDSLGHFRIIALQPLVRGSELSDADLKDFHSKYPMTVQGPWSKTKDGSALVTDLSPSNILKDADGNYFVIDADVVYNTPEMGGKVKFSNRISASEEVLEDSNNNFDVLQMAMENRKAPTTFTFSDGTTVQAPFQVNQQQAEALNAMNDFVHSDETSMTLSGYAGTGKTSLMEMLAKKMDREHRRIVFSATTNKAAAVLKSRVARSGFDAYTLNKVFGIAVEVDSNKKYDARNLVNVIRESDIISPGDVVVIDEASMINENNYKVLNQIAKENGLKIIYVGDKAQLAPVNETEVSRVFRNDGSRVVELTQVERTDDNAILKEATAIRNGERLSGESSFNERGEGVAYIPQSHKDKIGDVVKYFVPGLKSDPNYFRILAYTNAAVARYNEAVRRALGYTDNTPVVGEPIVGYANWGYDYRTKSYKFINSESYKVTKIGKPENAQFRVGGLAVRMQVLPITLEDSMGNVETFNFVDIKDNANNRHTATLLAQEKSKLWEQARHLRGRARADILSTINDIDKFLFVNDNIIEDGRTLQSKVFDFGYALTVHKSQGSTFTHVLMDDVDIQKARGNDTMGSINLGMMEDDGFDAANATQIDEGEELDLGITNYSPEPQQTVQTAPNNDKANIRQQLEYVGVSRATDTVTIISNNVKKEDTPLNHLPEQPKAQNIPASYEGMITPDANTVFVFGSNPEGRHGAGAAKTAKEKFGAIYGQGEGLQGNSYALPTKDLRVKENKGLKSIPPEQIVGNIKKMYQTALEHPDKQFKVAYTNGLNETTLNGYTGREMIQMFKDAGPIPSNVVFSKNWTDHWNEVKSSQQTQQLSKTSTIEDVYAQLKAQYAPNSSEAKLTDIVFQALRGTGVVIKAADLGDGVSGRFVASDNTILYNPDAVQDNTLLHEMIHAATSYYLEASNTNNFSSEVKIAINEIRECYNLLKQDFIETHLYENGKPKEGVNIEKAFAFWTSDNDTYGLTSPEEMVAELGKPEFVAYIKDFDKRHKGQNIFQRLIDSIAKLFGINKSYGNLESTLKKALVTLLTNPDKALMERYAEENRNVKENHKKLRESNHLDVMHRKAIADMVSSFPEDTSSGYIDSVLKIGKDDLDVLVPSNNQIKDVERLRDLQQGTIFVFENQLFFNLNGIPSLVGEEIHIPVRVYSRKGLTLNSFNLKRDQYGLDYIAETKPLFEEQQTPLIPKVNFIPHPIQMVNLGIETGERLIQVADEWKEQELKDLDRELGQVTSEEAKKSIIDRIDKIKKAVDKISLPNYEYMNDLYEDTLVDAEWKIDRLQELDNMIAKRMASEDYVQGEEDEILEQMDAILAATSEQDLHPNTTKQEEEVVQEKLNDYDKLNAQIDNLNNSDFISASEVRHAAELIMNAVSDEITRMQKEKGFAEKIFPSLKVNEDFNFQTATRKEIIETIGLPRLLDRAKELFNTEKVDFDDLSIEQQADVIYDNFDGILHFGTDIFAMNEGFGIKRNYRTNTYEVAESMEMNLDDEGNYNDTATTEEEEDLQEHWQIEQRTLDVLASATELVRMAIHECYQIDEKGNKVKSAWGIYERVNPREAVKNILRWTRGAQSLPDMVAMLERKKTDNPWLTQLINRLNDKSGNEADLQSQFYGVMKKSRQSYNITQLENGKYIVNFVNNNKSRKAIFNGIVAKLAMKEHPLFKKGIDRGLLGYKDKVGKDEDITLYKALYDLRGIEERLNHKEQLNSDMIDEAANNIEAAYKILGYVPLDNAVRSSITEDNIKHMTKQLGYIVSALEDEAEYEHQHTNATPYEPLTYKARNSIEGALKKFLDPVADILDDSATNVVFEDGKMYQEDVTPSYLTLLFEKFHLDEREFQKFIRREYGSSEWFKMKGSGPQTGWRFGWLKKLAADPEARKLFDQTVELNFNKHRYMKNMTPAEYAVSMIAHYFASDVENTAWFRVPMQSNKPSSEFIRFYAFKDANYKDSIVDEYYNLFLQELSRIQTVNMRNRSKNDPDFIKNWDTNGKKFNFLTYLNDYLKNSKKTGNLLRDAKKDEKLAKLIQMRENLEQMSSEQEEKLVTLVQEAIRNYMENKVSDILSTWEKTGIMEAAKNIQGIGKEDAEVRAALENFIWNDNYASVNILQLTVGDIAAYKDADDLQKRLAELHAPGIRANIYATDYKGNRVSDGKYRTVILKDFDDFVSNVIANISEVFDRKIAAARTEQEKKGLRALKDSLVRPRTYNADGSIKDRGGKYWNINVADAQGYSSPSSYRKKALMFGRWSRHSEDVYQKLLSGEYNFTDLEAAFQPLKPFVYSQLHKDVGITGEVESPIQTMNMPFQAKNAEYLLIMADALTRNEETSRPNLLRAIFRVMEDSERLNPTMGIDTVQFESAIKSGLQGAVDIHQFMNTPGGEEAAYTYMMNQMYQRGEDGLRSRQYNTRTFVHETSYDSYCLQQEVPAHFDNHHQVQGSQERMIIPSDLDVYKDPNGNREDEANKVYYEWNDPDGTHRKEDAQTFRREYERTISDNIEMSLDELVREFKLDTADTRVRNIALSEILQKEILDNPRYGIELFQACSVDKKTGEFRIPKGDPVQAKRIEQLINSIIKTKVNKQEIAGGPIVQVSNFGTSTQLRIRFNARSGGILKSEEEFTPTAKYKTYDEYKKAEQAGIAYFEVFAPMWMKEKLFNEFADNNGNIDVDAIEAVDPELLKMISYRIPTEDKYSIAPMKVVGFLPKEAGDAIMFPYELTEIDDSDFDVDKRYVMRKELNIVKARRKDLQYVLENKLTESWEKGHKDQKINKKWVKETVREFLDNPQKMRSTDRLMASLWKEYVRQAYYTETPESKRAQNNNKVLDMTWGVLTNEMTADKILNPGGFDNFKGIGYKIAAYKNSHRSWEELQGMSDDHLKEFSTAGKDLTFIDAQLHYYQQNAAGSNLIGVFAVNKVAHATLEGDHIFIAVDELCGEAPFTIAGKTFSGRMEIDPKYDDNGNLIGKTIGSGVSASADTAKEPVLDLMNINMSTAGIFNTLLRLGMPLENAALFMSQNVIKEVLDEFNRQNLSGSTSLNRVIEERLKAIAEEAKLTEESKINTEELTEEELIRGLKSGDTVVDYKVLKAFQKIKSLASVLRNPTFATRFNSITSAVGPLIIDNLVMKNKMDNFTYSEDTGGTNLYLSDGTPVDIHTIFSMHPILDSFSKGMGVAESMFRDMPAGSIGFDTVIQTLPGELKDKVMGDKKILSKLSDFYQSYLLIQAGLINPNAEKEGLRWYIEEFPKWFEKNNIQAKYPDNALVQDMAMTVSKKTGRTFMNVDTLGLKEPEKEKYRSAWTDLHKADPDLSMKLLTYWFFRGGIGFSPKTSTGLIPNFVKENFEVTLDNGEKVSYLDVFRRLPAVNPEIVIDQFIRNNWEESKLVPKKGGKNTHYSYDRLRKGILEIYSKEDIESLEGVTWMRTKHNNQTYLWKLIGKNAKGNIEYQLVKPLGDNAEYLEMSTENIINPMSETTLDVEDWESSERTPTSPAEDVDNEASEGNISEAEKSEDISKMADLIQNYRAHIESPVTAEAARKQVNTIKESKNQKQYVKFLSNVLKSNGIEVSEDEVLKKFNELC